MCLCRFNPDQIKWACSMVCEFFINPTDTENELLASENSLKTDILYRIYNVIHKHIPTTKSVL